MRKPSMNDFKRQENPNIVKMARFSFRDQGSCCRNTKICNFEAVDFSLLSGKKMMLEKAHEFYFE